METLFKLSPEELSKICIKAEFDEKEQLILKEENCFQKGAITFLKQPVRVKLGELLAGILDKTAIVKENVDCAFLYLFALADTKKHRETLRDFYENHHCDEYDCSGLDGYCTGWDEDRDFHVLEVCHEEM